MKYRIMIRTASGNKDQYQFLTFTNVNGEEEIWETDRLVELDKQVEKMLNGNYRKKDIQLVSPLDFSVFADVYDNDKYPPEPTPDPDPEPEPEPEPTPDPEPTPSADVNINAVTRVVTLDEEGADPTVVLSVQFTAGGDNLPEDGEYLWEFTVDGGEITKTSTGKILNVTDEDKDVLAVATSVAVTVGQYTSENITIE